MVVFLSILSIFVVGGILPLTLHSVFSAWAEHKNITKISCKTSGEASFKRFKKYFFSYQMKQTTPNKRIYIDPNYDVYVDAEIGLIRFEGVGMIMRTPLDYIQFLSFMTNATYYEKAKVETFDAIMLEKGPPPLSLDDPSWLEKAKEGKG